MDINFHGAGPALGAIAAALGIPTLIATAPLWIWAALIIGVLVLLDGDGGGAEGGG